MGRRRFFSDFLVIHPPGHIPATSAYANVCGPLETRAGFPCVNHIKYANLVLKQQIKKKRSTLMFFFNNKICP